jgi:hypothetical protein
MVVPKPSPIFVEQSNSTPKIAEKPAIEFQLTPAGSAA